MNNEYVPLIEILKSILGKYKSHNIDTGQISFDCPVCSYEIKQLDHGDRKGNLEVNYKENVFKCWVCSETHETHGTIYKLIKKFGNSKHLKDYLILKPEYGGITQKTYKKIELPKEFISITNASNGIKLLPTFKQGLNYLKERNINENLIKKNNIGLCLTGEYSNRIIIPSYDNFNNVNYFIARSFLSKSKLKYKNPEVEKETLIWNEKKINWNKPIYIVEGVFDSIFLENSIPLLGKFMSDYLFNKIYEESKDRIIIILDPDARSNQEKLFHRLNCGRLMERVWVIELEGDNDIADLCGDFKDYSLKKLD